MMEKTFIAEVASLHPILSWIRSYLEKTSFSEVEKQKIEIAIEEGLVNIFSYAYQEKIGEITISFNYKEGKFFEVIFKDKGLPFNPLKYKRDINRLIPIESLEEGGLGILFMQKLMDKVEYHRERNINVLTLLKNLSD